MRTGMVGCAMSHIQLCVELSKSDNDFFCILEDDVELVPDFQKKFVKVLSGTPTGWDMIYLGHHYYPQYRKNEYYDKTVLPVVEKWSREKSLKISMGGTGGYIISRKGAEKLLNFINKNRMVNCIDTMQQKAADELDIYYCIPHLIYSECWTGDNHPDTDIQFCYDSLTQNLNTRFVEELNFYKDCSVQTVMDFDQMKELVQKEGRDKVLFYRDEAPGVIVSLQNLCKYPYYTLEDKILIVDPTSQSRYFHRFKKDGKFDVTDALQYK